MIFLIIIAIPNAIIGEHQDGGPPKAQDLSNVAQQAVNTTKGSFRSINEFWQKEIVPFLKNIDKIVLNWWQESGRSFFYAIREKIISFLEKEIFI